VRLADYINKGLSILPLRPRSKQPMGRWRRWMREPMTVAESTSWWGTFRPQPNVGIITGAISGGLVVIDIEPEHVEYASTWDFPPMAPRVRTARGGLHIYFRGECGCSKLKLGDRVVGDVRGDGGYVVAPPSQTEDGFYTWIERWPDDPQEWSVDKLYPVPLWIGESNRTHTGVGGTASVPPPPVGVRLDPTEALRLVSSPLQRCISGGWTPHGAFGSASEMDFRIVRELIHIGASFESVCVFFDEFPFGDNARQHAGEDYLLRTYNNACKIIGVELEDAVQVRCRRVVTAPGSLRGGAQKRALLDLEDECGDLYSYSIAMILGDPFAGELSGEWRQVAVAFGTDPVPDSSIVTDVEVSALVSENRVLRLVNWNALEGLC